ncbi:hypothetical protein KJN74_04205 [Candidatus Bathyarchaeota archaeon]|nr:hypothetical protein [Candidatus Bathyarchaeota archaeon]
MKIAIVFLHEAFRFEVWLTGYNKNVQAKYWKLISDNNWNKHHIVSNINGVDSIIEDVLIKNPDFSDLDKMTKQIEKGTLNFIRNVENFLSNH